MDLKHLRSRNSGEMEDNWIVAYADLITLLFIFFILLLSMSQVNKQKFEQVSALIKSNPALTGKEIPRLKELKNPLKELSKKFRTLAIQYDLLLYSVQHSKDGLRIVLDDKALFRKNSYELKESVMKVLMKFYVDFEQLGSEYSLVIEGHSAGNNLAWATSSKKTVKVLKFLQRIGLNTQNLKLESYGSTRPRVEGKNTKNDRVVLRIY